MHARVLGLCGLGLCFGLVSSLTVSGCGDDDDGVSLGEAAPEIARIYCDTLYDCSCVDFGGTGFTSKDQCLASVESEIRIALDEGDAAGLKFNDQYVPKLRDLYQSIGCRSEADLVYGVLYGDRTALELEALARTKLFFGGAEADAQCETIVLNQSVSAFARADTCERDLYCTASNECRSLSGGDGEQGDPCGATADCAQGLTCAPTNSADDLLCAKIPDAGGTCYGFANLCENSYCDLADKTCKAFPDDGQMCAPDSPGALVRCSQYSECDAQDICRAAPGDGDPCNGMQLCQQGFTCDGSRCVAAAPAVCTG